MSWILRHGCSITQSYQQRVKYMWCSQKCEEDGDKCGCRSGWHSRELHAVGRVYSDAWDIQFRVSSYTSEPLGDLWLKSVEVFLIFSLILMSVLVNLCEIISYFMELSLRVTQEARKSVSTICFYLWFISEWIHSHTLHASLPGIYLHSSAQVVLDQDLIPLYSLKVWWDLWRFPMVWCWGLGPFQGAASPMTHRLEADALQESSLK